MLKQASESVHGYQDAKKLLCLAEEVREEASLPGEIHSEPTSLPEGSHRAVEGREQFLTNDNGRLPSLPVSEETGFSGKKLWEHNHMTAGKSIQTPPKRKRRRKLLCPATDPATEKPEETSLPGEIHSKPTSLPEGSHKLEENEQCLPVSKETKFPGENLPGYNHMTAEKLKQTRAPPRRKSQRSHLLKRDYCNGKARLQGQASQFTSKEMPLPAEVDGSVYEQSLRIIEVLGDLRDNGKWEEFDCEADQLLRKFFDCNDLLITVILEQGKAACFRNDQTSAEDFIKKASLKIRQESSSLVSLWKGRANTYLAEITEEISWHLVKHNDASRLRRRI